MNDPEEPSLRTELLEHMFWMVVGFVVLGFFLAIFLGGCTTVPSRYEVPVPTPVYCKPKLGPDPAYPDTDAALKAGTDIFAEVQLLLEGRDERIQRDKEKQAALDACAGPSPAPPQSPSGEAPKRATQP